MGVMKNRMHTGEIYFPGDEKITIKTEKLFGIIYEKQYIEV